MTHLEGRQELRLTCQRHYTWAPFRSTRSFWLPAGSGVASRGRRRFESGKWAGWRRAGRISGAGRHKSSGAAPRQQERISALKWTWAGTAPAGSCCVGRIGARPDASGWPRAGAKQSGFVASPSPSPSAKPNELGDNESVARNCERRAQVSWRYSSFTCCRSPSDELHDLIPRQSAMAAAHGVGAIPVRHARTASVPPGNTCKLSRAVSADRGSGNRAEGTGMNRSAFRMAKADGLQIPSLTGETGGRASRITWVRAKRQLVFFSCRPSV